MDAAVLQTIGHARPLWKEALLLDEDAWLSVWAKTRRDPSTPTVVTHWLPLHQHLADTAAVAGLLVDDWVSPPVIARIADDLEGDAARVRRLVVWLAAVHDVGKASPAFAVQDKGLADAMRRHGLVADHRYAQDLQRSRVRHELVGQQAVRAWLAEEMGFGFRGTAAQLACVVGGHHGIPSAPADMALVAERSDLAGTGEWERARTAVLRWATDLVGGPAALRRFGRVCVVPALAGLVPRRRRSRRRVRSRPRARGGGPIEAEAGL
jgi:CRISPR-associated endonuclease/helicase Cas3